MKLAHQRRALVSTLLMVSLSACSTESDPNGNSGSDSPIEPTTLTVYAASSLTATFEALGEEFEASHDGVEVTFNFAGSSDLVGQIQQGAPADVIATADAANMDKLTGDGLLGAGPTNFATNTLQIAVPPDNPAGIGGFADLADPGLALVVCAPEVPCGSAALAAAEAAGITLKPVSEEANVADVLGKVTSGEADAGLVYVTDVLGAGSAVTGIAFEESRAVVNTYPVATVAASEYADLAQEFVDLVLGPEGARVLTDAGFGPP